MSFLYSAFLQVISAVILWSIHVQKVPQALAVLRSAASLVHPSSEPLVEGIFLSELSWVIIIIIIIMSVFLERFSM